MKNSKDNGWIKLHRKMLDNPVVFKDPDHLAVWIYLLLSATHSDHETIFGGQKYVLKPGQLITGRRKIAHETGVEEHKVDRILKLFKAAQQIEQLSKPYGSVITILRWNDYQCCEPQSKQRMSNKRATNEQQMSTIQECKEGKEEKESKKIRDVFIPPSLEEVEAYCRERNNGVDPVSWWNFYNSKNWMVGKNKMTNWKSAIATWERRNKPANTPPQRPKRTQDEIAADIAHAKGMTLEEFKRAYGYD